jgi:hypothetical protein
MKGTFLKQYRSKKSGRLVFVYELKGTQEEFESYEESKGSYAKYSDETGNPLYFTTRFAGKSVNMLQKENGDWFIDTSIMDQAKSLAEENPFMQEAIANRMMDQLFGNMPVNTSTPAPKVVKEESAVASNNAQIDDSEIDDDELGEM